MKASVAEAASIFDTDGAIKRKVDAVLEKLKTFRKEYPYAENPGSIETLTSKDIIEDGEKETGKFFLYIQYNLSDIGHLILYTNDVYYKIRSQLDDFKELLYTVVDKTKTLAEKVDAPWQDIKGLGGDRHIAKKIIFCFNHENESVVPIFSTIHLEHFLDTILEKEWRLPNYESGSLGEKYEALTNELLKAKKSSPTTKPWEITYFSWFLYTTYPPPQKTTLSKTQQKSSQNRAILEQQQQLQVFMNLLNDRRRKDKISAEEWRTYRDRWLKNLLDRKTLTDQLSAL
jgi:hypothetical protein